MGGRRSFRRSGEALKRESEAAAMGGRRSFRRFRRSGEALKRESGAAAMGGRRSFDPFVKVLHGMVLMEQHVF
jgi:hypothetical protein